MLSKEERLAVERFILNVSVPVIYEDSHKDVPLGTATLFSLNDRYFLVTARHLFDDPVRPERIACPASPIKSEIFTLGKCVVGKPTDERYDVAVIELLEDETISRMKSGWQFLSRDNVSLPSNDGIFMLSGYPESLTSRQQGWLHGKLLTVYTNRLSEVPANADKPVDRRFDLFFEYNTKAQNLDGKTTDTPKLQGTSGASIWEYFSLNKGDVWTPEKALRVVGVQSTYRHKTYFRGASWTMVALALGQIDPTLLKI